MVAILFSGLDRAKIEPETPHDVSANMTPRCYRFAAEILIYTLVETHFVICYVCHESNQNYHNKNMFLKDLDLGDLSEKANAFNLTQFMHCKEFKQESGQC